MMPARRSQNWLPGIFNDFFGNEWVEKTNTASPAINIIESDNDYKVEVAAPGMTKDDFSIKIDPENQLIVSMEKKTENDEKDKKGKYLRREFPADHGAAGKRRKRQDRRESRERRADDRHSQEGRRARGKEDEGDRYQISKKAQRSASR